MIFFSPFIAFWGSTLKTGTNAFIRALTRRTLSERLLAPAAPWVEEAQIDKITAEEMNNSRLQIRNFIGPVSSY